MTISEFLQSKELKDWIIGDKKDDINNNQKFTPSIENASDDYFDQRKGEGICHTV